MTEVGTVLAAARKERDWSLREVERRSGVPNAHISQIETGAIRSPELATLQPLAKAYGIQLADLVPDGTVPPAGKFRVTIRVERPDGQFVTSSRLLRDDLLTAGGDEGMEQDWAVREVGAAFVGAYRRAAELPD
jgi:transcriptional regulator with XRE-family HTH domain